MTNPVSSPTAEPSKATSIATENAGTSAETPGLASANSHVQIEAYWLERKKYLQELKNIPELKIRYAKALAIYLLRRLDPEEHTSELQSRENLVCRLLLEKKKHTCRHTAEA